MRQVDRGSPASKAGILEEEWLLRVDGKAITSPLIFLRAVAKKEIGDSIQVDILAADGAVRSETLLLRPACAYKQAEAGG